MTKQEFEQTDWADAHENSTYLQGLIAAYTMTKPQIRKAIKIITESDDV